MNAEGLSGLCPSNWGSPGAEGVEAAAEANVRPARCKLVGLGWRGGVPLACWERSETALLG